jgi:predicted nucleic acid-binding protein
MTTNADVFCDTNVVIRLNIVETPEHARVKAAIRRLLADGNTLWISRQVLREFCMVLTRPQSFPVPVSNRDVVARARSLAGLFPIAEETSAVTDQLFRFVETIPMGGKQIYDANLVATMQVQGIKYLFTLNPSDFRRFSNTTEIITLDDLLV